jgi:tape measure domain-containing protein
MATAARIRYDIEANATGAAEVERLATELEQLDGAFPSDLAQQARDASRQLAALGEQQAAIDVFVQLKRDAEGARDGLDQAQAAAQAFARELAQSGTPTRTQAGQLERLRDAVRTAKDELLAQTRAVETARANLAQYGITGADVATKSVQLRTQVAAVRSEVEQLARTGQTASGFGQLVRDTDSARTRMEAAARAADEFGSSIGQSGPPTAAQATRLRELRAAADSARSEFEQLQLSTVEQAQALRQAGANTEQLTIAARQLAAAQQANTAAGRATANAYAEQGAAAQRAASQQAQAQTTVREGLNGIAGQLRTLQQLAGAALGGQLLGGVIGDISRTADAYSNLAGRIRLVTGEGAAFDQAFQGVFDIAQRTNSQLESTGQLFTRIAQAGRQIGVSTTDALSLTETINQAIQVSGASAESADAAIIQLIQGLQSGVLRGEEFNSVMEQAPRLAQALAAGLGVTTGELRKQAEAGRLTSEVVIGALQGQADVVAREFERLPPTVGRAITNLTTSWTRYVGEVDQANGISAAAASAINALAGNLDTLGTVLLAAGKAAAAYKAIQLAQTFLGNAQAVAAVTTARQAEALATTRATAATVADTAATATNTAAKNAAAAGLANVGSAAANAVTLGARLAGIFATLRTFTLVGVVTNLGTIGTALGEGIAKWMGYGKAIEDAERTLRVEEATARENARQAQALAQAKQLAAERALELTAASKQLVSEFEGVRAKGGTVVDALDKVSKSLQLGDIQSIRDAATALDALAVKGQITGEQVRGALASALEGADLRVFETNALAAFDNSEQGARRLAAALESVTIEALRRAGTSAQELQTGFSSATNSALNDVDILGRELQRLGTNASEAGRLLSGSLDRALDASRTERAVQAVIDRWEELGRQGLVTGEQLAAGLEQARGKLDELRPGVNSLDEALRTFGLRSQAQLQATAANFQQAWDQIRNSTQVGLADKIRAFEQYRDAATAANGGVVPSELRLQEELLKSAAAARDLKTSFDEVGRAGTSNLDRISERANQTAGVLDSLAERNRRITEESAASDAARRSINRTASDNSGLQTLEQKIRDGTLSANDLQLAQTVFSASRTNAEVASQNSSAFSLQGLRSVEDTLARSRTILEQVQSLVQANTQAQESRNPRNTRGTIQTAPQSTSHTVTIKIGGRDTTINAASAQDAQALAALLQQLGTASSRAS